MKGLPEVNDVEHVLAVQNILGEGPLWNSEEQALYWVDIYGHRFYRYEPATGELESFNVGLPVGALALRKAGGLVMATKRGFAFWDRQEGLRSIVDPEAHKPYSRFNDGAVDRQGRFWAGTMCDPEDGCPQPESSLYRLDPDLSLHVMATEVGIANGIGWSPDQRLMYFTDSPLRMIYVYDFDAATGTIENRRPFVHTPEEKGVPDGLTVDSEGFVWSACWGGGKITRYDPTGKVERVIQLPVQYPTSCTFGGPSLDELYITSAWTALSEEKRRQQPLAGDLFRLRTDIKGQEEPKFAG
jgi:sugar lactone lactonase YvrE